MNYSDTFEQSKTILKELPNSPFYDFSLQTRDITFRNKRGTEIDRWELFTRGCRDLTDVIKINQSISINRDE